jgi:uncharacterized caspase-like protein
MGGTREALLVGVDVYQDPGLGQLRSPAQGVEGLARVLGDPAIGAFNVETVINQPEHIIRRKIATFFDNRKRDDFLLMYLSCHAVKDANGELYFAAKDTTLHGLEATAVSSHFISRQMERSRSRCVVLFLDSCYSGAFARGMSTRIDEGIDLKSRFEGHGRAIFTASSAMEYTFDEGELSKSAAAGSANLTATIIRGLETGAADRNGDGWISFDELYDYVYEHARRSWPSQTPGKWIFGVHGGLLIARGPSHRPGSKPP